MFPYMGDGGLSVVDDCTIMKHEVNFCLSVSDTTLLSLRFQHRDAAATQTKQICQRCASGLGLCWSQWDRAAFHRPKGREITAEDLAVSVGQTPADTECNPTKYYMWWILIWSGVFLEIYQPSKYLRSNNLKVPFIVYLHKCTSCSTT